MPPRRGGPLRALQANLAKSTEPELRERLSAGGAEADTYSEPIDFLEWLRPGGPWVLTAIIPNGATTTITARDANEVREFIRANDGEQNLYFSVNPTRRAMRSKAAKTDIAAIEFLFADLDPRDDESPEAAKRRYLEAFKEPKPAAVIDSGNGIQGLWRLAEPIELAEPVLVADQKRKTERAFSPKTAAIIADVEARTAALMRRLGSVVGTQNIDRIFRLPGTINLPNKAKLEKGRVACPTKLIRCNEATCKLDDFPAAPAQAEIAKAAASFDWDAVAKHAGWLKTTADLPSDFNEKGKIIVAHKGNLNDLNEDLEQAGLIEKTYRTWSHVSMALAAIFKADQRFPHEQIAAALMCPLECNQHIARQPDKNRAVERLLNRSYEPRRRQQQLTVIGEIEAPTNSEEALALQFAERLAGNLRYVAAWHRWLQWDGLCWRFDETRQTFSLARELCRGAAVTIFFPSQANTIASAKTRAAVVSLASEDRRLAATVEQWDADPWLLNTPGGVIDLRSGACRPARPEDYMTKSTAVAPNSECPTPLWSEFLDRVTDGDKKLQEFLARMCGYGLTGLIIEHALFFLYGRGANGKGVFMNTISSIAADYARAAPIETFTDSKSDRHPTELAMLRGARIVTATETEEGRRWAESKIKMLTGGDIISARFMRQDFFEYYPQFKLIISGNHKPALRSVDEAIRRRINLIPWSVVIPPEERDRELTNKLKAERPGILAWMIAGCMEWQRIGLAPPAAVTEATEEYLAAEDAFAGWLDENVTLEANAWTRTKDLFASWKEWAERTGGYVGSMKRLAENLKNRGFEQERRGEGKVRERGFKGIRL